jgi:HNH endonuclease
MVKCIELKWIAGDARGYTDRFALDEFARRSKGAERVHLVLGPRGGRYHARCLIRVSDKWAALDYRAFKAFNNRHNMELGVLTLHFNDSARTSVKDVSWDGERLEEDEIEIAVVERSGLSEQDESVDERKYALAQRALRPKQLELYLELERTYGGCCAISSCPVPFALVAAHLLPVGDGGDDVPTNAILLRADLHALFDTHQLGIHPRSGTAYVSHEAQAWAEYKKFHGVRALADPQPGFEANKPSRSALAKRWKMFIANNPDVDSLVF